jgi:hypothetical protein
MLFQYVQTLAGANGHHAILSDSLATDRGWDVRAELDHRPVILRHCSDWPAVEWFRDCLRRELQ